MAERPSYGQDLISAARRERTPHARDKNRIYQAVIATAAGIGLVGSGTAVSAGGAGIGWVAALKWAGVAAVVISGAVVGSRWVDRKVPPPQAPAASQQQAATTPSPQTADPRALAPASNDDPSALEKRRPAQPSALPTSRARPAQAAAPVDNLAGEVDLLRDAHDAWRGGQPSRALALATEHSRRYPRSQLRSESRGLRVLALCALGRTTEARRVARQLASEAPDSPVLATLGDSCLGK